MLETAMLLRVGKKIDGIARNKPLLCASMCRKKTLFSGKVCCVISEAISERHRQQEENDLVIYAFEIK